MDSNEAIVTNEPFIPLEPFSDDEDLIPAPFTVGKFEVKQTISSATSVVATKHAVNNQVSSNFLTIPASLVSSKEERLPGTLLLLSQRAKDSQEEKQVIKIKTATKRNHHQCIFCCTFFKERKDLLSHITIHNGETPPSVVSTPVAESPGLRGSSLSHTVGEKRFTCDICHKKFNVPSELLKHRRIHTGEKPFKCDVCPKTFSDPSALRSHKRTHTGERPYSCDICGKSFTISFNLKRHQRIHTGEKPHTCEFCGKTFRQLTILNTHRRRHTGEKPFSCNICNKKFTQSANLECHKAYHCVGDTPV